MIWLRHSRVLFTPEGCETIFNDGATIRSYPHNTHHYHVIAHRCGYGDDILRYCQEHDFAHLYVWETFYDAPSPILWAVAHETEPPHPATEEIATTAFQRWLRAAERPIVGGVNWDALKTEALALLGDQT